MTHSGGSLSLDKQRLWQLLADGAEQDRVALKEEKAAVARRQKEVMVETAVLHRKLASGGAPGTPQESPKRSPIPVAQQQTTTRPPGPGSRAATPKPVGARSWASSMATPGRRRRSLGVASPCSICLSVPSPAANESCPPRPPREDHSILMLSPPNTPPPQRASTLEESAYCDCSPAEYEPCSPPGAPGIASPFLRPSARVRQPEPAGTGGRRPQPSAPERSATPAPVKYGPVLTGIFEPHRRTAVPRGSAEVAEEVPRRNRMSAGFKEASSRGCKAPAVWGDAREVVESEPAGRGGERREGHPLQKAPRACAPERNASVSNLLLSREESRLRRRGPMAEFDGEGAGADCDSSRRHCWSPVKLTAVARYSGSPKSRASTHPPDPAAAAAAQAQSLWASESSSAKEAADGQPGSICGGGSAEARARVPLRTLDSNRRGPSFAGEGAGGARYTVAADTVWETISAATTAPPPSREPSASLQGARPVRASAPPCPPWIAAPVGSENAVPQPRQPRRARSSGKRTGSGRKRRLSEARRPASPRPGGIEAGLDSSAVAAASLQNGPPSPRAGESPLGAAAGLRRGVGSRGGLVSVDRVVDRELPRQGRCGAAPQPGGGKRAGSGRKRCLSEARPGGIEPGLDSSSNGPPSPRAGDCLLGAAAGLQGGVGSRGRAASGLVSIDRVVDRELSRQSRCGAAPQPGGGKRAGSGRKRRPSEARQPASPGLVSTSAAPLLNSPRAGESPRGAAAGLQGGVGSRGREHPRQSRCGAAPQPGGGKRAGSGRRRRPSEALPGGMEAGLDSSSVAAASLQNGPPSPRAGDSLLSSGDALRWETCDGCGRGAAGLPGAAPPGSCRSIVFCEGCRGKIAASLLRNPPGPPAAAGPAVVYAQVEFPATTRPLLLKLDADQPLGGLFENFTFRALAGGRPVRLRWGRALLDFGRSPLFYKMPASYSEPVRLVVCDAPA
ncbi:hypothetical protein DIPPA_06124 [Diplonema papillatum]|nr:hypothetical protein DIPPA_06124 [Diplonema papillatum]